MPVEWAHREIVVFSVPDGKLFLEVSEGIELVVGVEILIIFTVTALNLAVMPRRERLDAHMLDTESIQRRFKERFLAGAL